MRRLYRRNSDKGGTSELDVDQMNASFALYNGLAAQIAADAEVPFVDVWPAFTVVGRHLAVGNASTRRDKPCGPMEYIFRNPATLSDVDLLRKVAKQILSPKESSMISTNERWLARCTTTYFPIFSQNSEFGLQLPMQSGFHCVNYAASRRAERPQRPSPSPLLAAATPKIDYHTARRMSSSLG